MQTARKIEDTIIIGGGVSGLACAYWLRQSGRRVLVLEAERFGGVIETDRLAGYTLEQGPDVFLEKPDLKALIEALGLGAAQAFPVHKRYRQMVWYKGAARTVPRGL